ncbi:MAG: hypothetical protein ACI9BK_000944 [Acidimicrobiales bacterium]
MSARWLTQTDALDSRRLKTLSNRDVALLGRVGS